MVLIQKWFTPAPRVDGNTWSKAPLTSNTGDSLVFIKLHGVLLGRKEKTKKVSHQRGCKTLLSIDYISISWMLGCGSGTWPLLQWGKKDRRMEAIKQMVKNEVWMLAVDNILPQETLSAPAWYGPVLMDTIAQASLPHAVYLSTSVN